MKRILFLLLLVSALAALPVQAQIEPDVTEDDLLFSPPFLSDGDIMVEALSPAVQAQLYAFDATKGDRVTVTMTQIDDDLDPFLVLLGPAGEVLARDDDSGPVSLSAEISEVTIPASGTYFVMATSYYYVDVILDVETDQEDLDYELSISGITQPEFVDEGDDTFTYYAGTLESGVPTEGYSTLEEPVFYYNVTGRAGDMLNMTMSSDEFDTILHVFSPSGERIAVNDDADGTNSAIAGLELPVDGTYLIFATDLFFYNAGVDMGTGDESVLNYQGGTFEITLDAVIGSDPA